MSRTRARRSGGLIFTTLDILFVPVIALAAFPMKSVRRIGLHRLRFVRATLLHIGVLPIRDHYYEPFVDLSRLKDLGQPRILPGIDFDVAGQLALLASFADTEGLAGIPDAAAAGDGFAFGNGSFESGDAELWFHIVRHFRPKRIIEIGSGNSTLMARLALARTEALDPSYRCDHVCIEPYEMPWLEKTGARVERARLEDVDLAMFDKLEANDIVFIDSSHIIRPQGEVVMEYLQLLPRLGKGVIVHVHDIFSPRDYLSEWVRDELLLWNEQYLLEAFLTLNDRWEVLLAANMLHHDFPEELAAKCPYLTADREPGSFYIRHC